MTILRIAPRVPPLPGGEERHILELTREQAAAGHRVILLYAGGDPGQGDGWESHHVPPLYRGRPETLELLTFGTAIRRWLRQNPIACDLVHAHGDFIEAGLAADLGRRLGCPAVLTCHASWSAQGTWRDRFRRRAFGRLDQMFTVSSELAQRVRALGVTTPLTAQHSGTRLEALTAIPREPAAAPTLVAVGSLLPMKGHAILLEAIRRLAPDWPALRLELLGDGPLRAELEAAATDLPQVVFRGSVGAEEVYRTLRRAWIFVLSSIELPGSGEGVPTALVEALAAGLPAVVTDVGGVRDVLRDGQNGLLVPERDPAALATGIDRLLRDETLRADLAERAAEGGRGYDWPAVAAVFTGVCEKRVAERRRSP